MLVDALIAADPYLDISDAIDDMGQYTYLTDGILKEIERSKVNELAKSRKILERLRKRDLYKCVDYFKLPFELQQYATKDNFNEEKVLSFSERDEEKRMKPDDIYVEILPISYCMGDKNPVDAVEFVSKWQVEVPFRQLKDQVSLFTPEIFREITIRVFARERQYYKPLYRVFERFIVAFGKQYGCPITLEERNHAHPPASEMRPPRTSIEFGDIDPNTGRPSTPLQIRLTETSPTLCTSTGIRSSFDDDDDESENDDEDPLKRISFKASTGKTLGLSVATPEKQVGTTPTAKSMSAKMNPLLDSQHLTPRPRTFTPMAVNLGGSLAVTPVGTPTYVTKSRSFQLPDPDDYTVIAGYVSPKLAIASAESSIVGTPVKCGREEQMGEGGELFGSAHKRKRVG
ncbi:SAM domain and HD [Dinochytrium kinnereticum]|nr:SAM domain and HD [Dinochytrium kinnereticum]